MYGYIRGKFNTVHLLANTLPPHPLLFYCIECELSLTYLLHHSLPYRAILIDSLPHPFHLGFILSLLQGNQGLPLPPFHGLI